MKEIITFFMLMAFFAAAPTYAQQTSAFTYQGNLKDGANAANGNYDFEFRLFDAISGGSQIGTTATVTNVIVSGGSFTAKIDFGDALWTGFDRYLEIRVRNAGAGNYVLLNPREKMLSTPHAIRSVFATEANLSINSQNSTLFGGFGVQSFVFTNDPRLTDARPPTAGSNFYIRNNELGQNVDINANGTIHSTTIWGETVRATNQYNLGNARVLHTTGGPNIFVGIGAGSANSSGALNAFYGSQSGAVNTTGSFNSFFGGDSGNANILGNHNSFFGARAGFKTTSSFNAFFGSGAGFENTTGHSNSFLGYLAGSNNSTGIENSFFGRNSGIANTAGDQNTFVGAYSGSSTTNGNSNAFFGSSAGRNNTTGGNNAFFGAGAGFTSTTAANNSFFGTNAGFANSSGTNNSFFGQSSGSTNSSGNENSLFGARTNNRTGSSNSVFGFESGASNSSGSRNSFFGHSAGDTNTTGDENSFFGASAGTNNGIGSNNSYFGYLAGAGSTAGTSNTFIGHNTGSATTIGNNNTFIGKGAGTSNTTGSDNTLIGYNAEVSANNLTFATAIGSGAIVDESNKIVIGRQTDNVFIPGRLNFYSFGQSGNELCFVGGSGFPKSFAECGSSRRYKHEIYDYKGGISLVTRFRPVTFKWNNTNDLDLGLIAEEVAEIDPVLAVYKDGEIEGVKYRQMTVVLINAIKEQQAQIEELKSANQELKSAVCGLIPSLAVCGKKEK